MIGNKKTKISKMIRFLVGLLIAIIIILPLLITFFASVKTANDMVLSNPLLPPKFSNITFDNYAKVLSNTILQRAFINSMLIVVVSLVFNIFFGSIVAYILERFQFRGRSVVFGMFFLGMLLPTEITEIARFKIIQSMGLYNTLAAPIVIYVAADLMQIYIYRQYISGLPEALDESAIIDGCTYFGVFRKIIFPLLKPATATLIIIKAIGIINDMYVPYLYMPARSLKTLTTFLMSYMSQESGSWQNLSAAVMVVLIPTLIIYIVFQNKIVDGLAAGAVKG